MLPFLFIVLRLNLRKRMVIVMKGYKIPMYRKCFEIFKHFIFIFIFIFIRTYYLYYNKIFSMLILFFLITIVIINDYIRKTKLTITFWDMHTVSLLFAIILSSILTYFIGGFGTINYLIFPLEELLQLEICLI